MIRMPFPPDPPLVRVLSPPPPPDPVFITPEGAPFVASEIGELSPSPPMLLPPVPAVPPVLAPPPPPAADPAAALPAGTGRVALTHHHCIADQSAQAPQQAPALRHAVPRAVPAHREWRSSWQDRKAFSPPCQLRVAPSLTGCCARIAPRRTPTNEARSRVVV